MNSIGAQRLAALDAGTPLPPRILLDTDPENLLTLHDEEHPSCTTAEGYKWWRSGRLVSVINFVPKNVIALPPLAGTAGFCEDCTPEYQQEMAQAGRCDHPEILFYHDDEGLLQGTQKVHMKKIALTSNEI